MSHLYISKKILASKLLIIASAVSLCCSSVALADTVGSPWTYQGKNGPAHWGNVDSDFELCSTGIYQSPINIQTKDLQTLQNAQHLNIQYHFDEDDLIETQRDVVVAAHKDGQVTHTGHTLQIDVHPSEDSMVTFNKEEYELVKFHFHTPGEHTLDGKSFPIEAHYIHQDEKGDLLVIGVFMTVGDKANNSVATILKNAPKAKHHNITLEGPLNMLELIPAGSNYYTYKGSLTTPPCSQNVQWIVLDKTVSVSKAQLKQLEKILNHNARPLQSIGNRMVTQNNIQK